MQKGRGRGEQRRLQRARAANGDAHMEPAGVKHEAHEVEAERGVHADDQELVANHAESPQQFAALGAPLAK